jgi:hypothetical protein
MELTAGPLFAAEQAGVTALPMTFSHSEGSWMDPITSIVMALAAGAAAGFALMGAQVMLCLPTGDLHGPL